MKLFLCTFVFLCVFEKKYCNLASNVYAQIREDIKDKTFREYALANVRQAVNFGQMAGTALSLVLPSCKLPSGKVHQPPKYIFKPMDTKK